MNEKVKEVIAKVKVAVSELTVTQTVVIVVFAGIGLFFLIS